MIEKNPHVTAWAKNDHLGFEILYVFDGVVRKYLPDFLIQLDNGKTLILETKGQETRRDKEKRKALSEWVSAVNSMGEYGEWCNDVSYKGPGILPKSLRVRTAAVLANPPNLNIRRS